MQQDIKVKKLPIDKGVAAWNAILGEQASYPNVDKNCTYDWVVVGAGFTGLAAARRLTQLVGHKERIAVLDASRLAHGPAGRNSGFMIDLPHELNSETYSGGMEDDLRKIKLNRAAIQFAKELAAEYEFDPKIFDPCGKVTAACTEKGSKHIHAYAKHLEALNEHHDLLSAAYLKQWTGTDFYTEGLFTPGAVMIQPAAFIHKSAAALQDKVDIYENSPVLSMTLGETHRLNTPKGEVRTKNVILAVNGHVQSFGFFPRQLLHVFTYASMTRKLTVEEIKRLGGVSDWGILPADPLGTTVRRISDHQNTGHRIIIRNQATLNQSIVASCGDMKRAKFLQDRSFENRFPMLKGVEMEYRWGGRLCLSLNSVPAFGEVENRVYAAACQNGLGTVKGTLSGMMAAELAVLKTTPMLDEFLHSETPKKLPPEPFLSLGANATMRWKEWQAGIEL
ncbi:NAD(P)/FAD-dependent oxidoreductase [Vibrio fluvialis]|uniref:NAD(P)/FAD-dependent oxidoreductase n=1 Tax=Vibrio fluvialis TaxID=676 RepID=UPI000509E015|nr:FAD-binding oxidoreductase [Vibrio fluvialis]